MDSTPMLLVARRRRPLRTGHRAPLATGHRILALLAVLLLSLVSSACRDDPQSLPVKNVILVLVDTLRADHLSLYGYERATSPRLEWRARNGVVFENARSQASCTYPSVNSLLTSRWPTEFLDQPGGFLGIPPDTATLASILSGRGFSTLAVSASPIVRKSPSRHNPDGGFDVGFQAFDEACQWDNARCVIGRADALLGEPDRRFFLYVHFMEPHDPFTAPPDHPRRFSGAYESQQGFVNEGSLWRLKAGYYGELPPVSWTERDLQHLVDLYDDEITFFDAELDRWLDRLAASGLLDDTLVVLTSDHGEHLRFEHMELEHCRTLYEEAVHIPLVVWGPGLRAGRRVSAQAQNIDLVPTILDLLGIDADASRLQGRSLRPWLEGDDGERGRVGFAAQSGWLAAFDDRHKLLVHLPSREQRLFDLQVDPREQYDLRSDRRKAFSRLGRSLVDWVQANGLTKGEIEERSRISDERLRSLGYL